MTRRTDTSKEQFLEAMDRTRERSWNVRPVIFRSKKDYDRNRVKQNLRREQMEDER